MENLWDKIKAGRYHLHFIVSFIISFFVNLIPFLTMVTMSTHKVTYMVGAWIIFNVAGYFKETRDKAFSWMDVLSNNIGWVSAIIVVLLGVLFFG